MKNTNRDNTILPLCRQDTKKEKHYEVKPTTHRPPPPRCCWHVPRRHRPKKHEQGQYQNKSTRQESASRRGRVRAGRQGRRGTPGVAHPAGCK
jgi:hypothetical protein